MAAARRSMLLASLFVAALACPSGNVRFVDSAATADYTVRFVRSPAVATCVIRWVNIAPGPGEWSETAGIADFTVYRTTGIADLLVHARG